MTPPADEPTPAVRVDRSRWAYVVATLERQAPTRDQAHYARLRHLRSQAAADGFLSKSADQLRRAMGGNVSPRTAERTLCRAVRDRLLDHDQRGRKYRQAVYWLSLPAELVEPRTVAVMRLDPVTGERLPNGRRPSSSAAAQPVTNDATAQVGGSTADGSARHEPQYPQSPVDSLSARHEPASQPVMDDGPLVLRDREQPPPFPAPPGELPTRPGPDERDLPDSSDRPDHDRATGPPDAQPTHPGQRAPDPRVVDEVTGTTGDGTDRTTRPDYEWSAP